MHSTNILFIFAVLQTFSIFSASARELDNGWQRLSPEGIPIPFDDAVSLGNATIRQTGSACTCIKEHIFSKTRAYGHPTEGKEFTNLFCLRHNERVKKVVINGYYNPIGIEFHTTRTTYVLGADSFFSISMDIAENDHIKNVRLCYGDTDSSDKVRIKQIRVGTQNEKTVSRGEDDGCALAYIQAPYQEEIVGAFGRADGPLYQIGFITKPKICLS